jgi:hypothetical protein
MGRRRLAIAALALLVFGGGWWWSMRSNIDPRLVGTWHRRAGTTGPLIREFHDDAGVDWIDPHESGPWPGSTWQRIGDRIYIIPSTNGRTTFETARRLWRAFTYRVQYGIPSSECFQILELSYGRLRLQELGGASWLKGRVQTYYLDPERAAHPTDSIPDVELAPRPVDPETVAD